MSAHWIERSEYAAKECELLLKDPKLYFWAAEKTMPEPFNRQRELFRIILWHFNPENHKLGMTELIVEGMKKK